MTTPKDIEEIVEEFWIECHGKSAHKDGWIGIDGFSVEKAQDWLRTTLTTLIQHHEAKVENLQAVMDTVVMLHEQEEMNDTAFCKLRDLLHAIVLTPTKTDKQ